jgi:cytochrome c peroxidase
MFRPERFAVSIAALLLLTACNDNNENQSTSTADPQADEVLTSLVAERGGEDTLSFDRTMASIESPKAQLGMQLFFSKALGGDRDSACVTCHHPLLGGGDNLSLPVGVGALEPDLLGPGRQHSSAAPHYDGGPTVPRNAPTTFNIAFWDRTLFHDGRLEALEPQTAANGSVGGIRTPDTPMGTADPAAGANLTVAQARFPVTSPEEMRGFVVEEGQGNTAIRNRLADRLALRNADMDTNSWLQAFRAGFGQPDGDADSLITYANIADAIGEYENSQVFIDSPWRAYLQGDVDAISAQAKQGAMLFFQQIDEGGADCVACHRSSFFTDEQFHVIAMPQIGRGKGDGPDGSDDFGRARETGLADDRYAFRTPSLLNVEVTGPWGHAGAYTSLEEVVRHHLAPATALANFDYSRLADDIAVTQLKANGDKALAQLTRLREENKSLLPQGVQLDDDSVAAIVAFLHALTDPCVKSRECLQPWIPDATTPSPDDLRLIGYDLNDNAL